jgi:bacteriorhodopsin
MKKLKLFALTVVALLGVTGVANADPTLQQDDFVGITFWVISMGMLAATAFFFMEAGNVAAGWRTSVIVAGLITGIAFIHYMYMREVWVTTYESPTVYRYIDWLITVPLQMVEFFLILSAVGRANSGMFWRLLIGSVVMLAGGYLGEANHIDSTLGFIIGMAGWIYILYEVFSGESGKAAAKSGNKALVIAFGTLRMIITVGWAIYPLGYVFGHLAGGVVDAESLNIVYNLADFVNKIAFGLVIWAAATSSGGRRTR